MIAANPMHTSNLSWRLSPQTGLLACFIALLPIQLDTPILLRLAPSDVVLGALILASLPRIRLRRQVWSIWHSGLVLMFIVSLFRIGVLDDNLTSYALLNKSLGLVALLGCYVVVTSNARTSRHTEWMLGVLARSVTILTLLTGTTYLVVGLLSGASNPPFSFAGRYSGTLVDPNAYGGLLTAVLAIHLVTRAGKQPILPGKWGPVANAVLTIGIVLTGSRSAWLAMVIVYLASLLIDPTRSMKIVFAMVVPSFVLLWAAGLTPANVYAGSASRQFSIDKRFEILDQAIDDFITNPIFGIGLGQYFERHGYIVHNTPVWFLVDFGLVGFVVFVGLCSWVCWRCWVALQKSRLVQNGSLVVGLALSHLAMIAFSIGIEAFYQRHWWLIMALCAGLASPTTVWLGSSDSLERSY